MIRFEEDADGHEVSVRMNETLEISLAETRTTGFRWVAETTGDPVCSLVSESSPPPVGPPGQPGRHVWQFRVVQHGTAGISLRYGRPWEHATTATRTFQIRVHVTD